MSNNTGVTSAGGNNNNTGAVGGNPSPVDRLLSILAKGDLRDLLSVVNILDEIMKRAQYLNKQDLASLYLKLMDRIFGEEVTGAQVGVASTNLTIQSVALASANGNWIKGELGGWYRKMININALARLGPLRGKHEVSMVSKTLQQSLSSPDHDRLVKYLAAQSPFITFLQNHLRKIFEWKSNQLPHRLQMIIMDHPLYPCLRSDSTERLWQLLHGGHLDAKEREFIRTNKSVRLDCIEYFMVNLLRYPVKNSAYISKTTSTASSSSSSSLYSSSYATSRQSVTATSRSPVEVLRRNGCMGWVEGVPYLVTLMDYMHEYLLLAPDASPSVASITSPNGSQTTITTSVETKTRLREVFTRLCIDYWIALGNVLHHDQYMVTTYRSMLNNSTASSANLLYPDRNKQKPHPDPTETVVLDYDSFQWTSAICQCSYLLLWTSLRDMQAIHGYITKRGEELKDGQETPHVVFGHNDPAWSQLQQPLYDMIRCVFSKGDQAKIGRDVFFLTVELWLLYLQPWSVHGNHLATASSASSTSTGNSSVNLSQDCWKKYIAYNLHFYTTLLPCFLKVISKMNISPLDSEGSDNLDVLNRVLKVFSSDLIHTMVELSSSFADWYANQAMSSSNQWLVGNGRTPRRDSSYLPSPSSAQTTPTKKSTRKLPTASPTAGNELNPACYFLMKDQHIRLYPDPRINELPDHGITDYRQYCLSETASIVLCIEMIQDTQRKSEETKQQQQQASVWFSVRELFSEPSAPTSVVDPAKFALLGACYKQLKSILPQADLSKELDQLKSTAIGLGVNGEEDIHSADIRDKATGKLSEKGKELVRNGKLQFRPHDFHAEISFHEDPLYLPCCSFEFPLVLRLAQLGTEKLNAYWQLPAQNKYMRLNWVDIFEEERKTHPNISFLEVLTNNFRFNLRVLATYRVLGMLVFGVLCVLIRCGCVPKLVQVVLAVLLAWVMYEGAFPTNWYKL